MDISRPHLSLVGDHKRVDSPACRCYSRIRLGERNTALKCPECQAVVKDDSHFCGRCGAALTAEGKTATSFTKTFESPYEGLNPGTIFAGRHRILEETGRGGMGVVYKAEDTRLERTVALKFLPPELMRDEDAKARFIREAKAAAALDHPNICTVFEVDEVDGRTFIAMAFIEGRSLKDRIAAGPLPLEEALEIAAQVAEGLKEAHDKGIVHRDIKPANIMLTVKGQPKIMDFGLAKLSGGADLTKPAMIMGTAAYMSPEQARGEAVDRRTDIWSFGATLYEMLTCRKPFGQKHDQALIYSILNDAVEHADRIRPEISRFLDQIIQKALEKDRSRRYQNMAELLKDLKSGKTSERKTSKADKSIIVLPFEDMSPGKDHEYFSDGLTEEIISDLSHVHDLLVISRSSAMTFKGARKKCVDIAREVNVRYVLEGSVRKAGNSLRIAAQLIDGANDSHVWAEKYAGTLDDVFDIQEKVSRSIIDALKMKLSAEEAHQLTRRPINNVRAYECYLKARHEIYTFTKESLDRAVRYLQDGLEIIGENATIYAGLGFAYIQYANAGIEQEKHLAEAEEYLNKALAIDSQSLEAHISFGFLNVFFGNVKQTIHHWNQALAIFPHDPDLLLFLWMFYMISWGKPHRARHFHGRLMQVDPLHPFGDMDCLIDVMGEGRLDLPVDRIKKSFYKNPQHPAVILLSALGLSYCGHFEEACALVEENVKPEMQHVFGQIGLFLMYAIKRDINTINELLTADFVESVKRDAENSYYVAGLSALTGMKDEALDWLENAVQRGFINYPFMNEYDPFLKQIRREPRFKKLMERAKHEWEKIEDRADTI
jgi:eukaryotic-like serine/threonine-protein kinase